ncbi:hypothetical protein L0Z36_10270 [Burkholderia multivorans]|uniref:hypothetical protein n=1 Tax=Burkholderia multivorans TaxID=87883 RepID=UPI0020190C28|nr:hypothetical protein [Burkholderia multivorans]UQP02260.1 hypothetical protein L0Z36_10270 [Burkholderia multivorans]
MLEKTVETYLVDRVRAAGGDAYKFTSPQRRSVPDRIVAFQPGRLYFVELKRPGNKPTKPQLREHERLRTLGCDVRVIDSREAVDAFVREASAPPAPYLYVYEYPSPFGGTHREFSPTTWNGQQPARTVALYATLQPEFRTADETGAEAVAIPAGWKLSVHESDGRMWLGIDSPNGAGCALSAVASIDEGRGSTIAAQVLRALAADLAAAAPQPARAEAPAGHCERVGGCLCGGDLPRVREGCAEWVKP